MSTRPDDHAPDLRIVIPGPRSAPDRGSAPDRERVLADDRLIEDVRAGRVTADSPRVARILALWRQSVLA